MIDVAQLIQWLLYGVMSGCAMYAVNVLSKMKDSIDQLNIQVAVIIEKHDTHDKEIEELKTRLHSLEIK